MTTNDALYLELLAACRALFDAPHYEHFAVRLNLEELTALERIRQCSMLGDRLDAHRPIGAPPDALAPPWWESHFPKRGDAQACEAWRPLVHRRALATRVLAVANTRIEGAWAAYIDGVPGFDHGDEIALVLERGTKLDEPIALLLFPEFEGIRYAL